MNPIVKLGPPPSPNRKDCPFVGTVDLPGLPMINIENQKGTTRSGVDPDGNPWSVILPAHYGEFDGILGVDGDPIDVYVGDNRHAPFAYLIPVASIEDGSYDEDKLFIGFDNLDEVCAAFRAAYNKPGFRFDVTRRFSIPKLADWLATHGDEGKRIEAGREMHKGLHSEVREVGGTHPHQQVFWVADQEDRDRVLGSLPVVPHEAWEDMPDEVQSPFPYDDGDFLAAARRGLVPTLSGGTRASVRLDDLLASQETVSRSKVRSILEHVRGGGRVPLPRVWERSDGSRVIVDGTHRLAAAAYAGNEHADVEIVRASTEMHKGAELDDFDLGAFEQHKADLADDEALKAIYWPGDDFDLEAFEAFKAQLGMFGVGADLQTVTKTDKNGRTERRHVKPQGGRDPNDKRTIDLEDMIQARTGAPSPAPVKPGPAVTTPATQAAPAKATQAPVAPVQQQPAPHPDPMVRQIQAEEASRRSGPQQAPKGDPMAAPAPVGQGADPHDDATIPMDLPTPSGPPE